MLVILFCFQVGMTAGYAFLATIFIILFPVASEAWEILNTIKEKRTIGILDAEATSVPVEVEKGKPDNENLTTSSPERVVNSNTKCEPSCSQSAASNVNNGGQGVDMGFAQPTETTQDDSDGNNHEPIF